MHQRLDRLLRWRESAERWSVYSQMPPVLLLATTPRQTERWQLASERTAEALHLHPLQGAVTCCFSEQGREISPWRAAWRTLDTNRPCHLQDLLVPQTPPAVPGLAVSSPHIAIREHSIQQDRFPQRPYELARSAARVDLLSDPRLAAFHLTPLHWSILSLLYAHPLMSTSELAVFSAYKGDSLEKGLARVQQLGYIEAKKLLEMREKGSASKRWILTENGLHLLAASANWPVLRLGRPSASTGSLQQMWKYFPWPIRKQRALLHPVVSGPFVLTIEWRGKIGSRATPGGGHHSGM